MVQHYFIIESFNNYYFKDKNEGEVMFYDSLEEAVKAAEESNLQNPKVCQIINPNQYASIPNEQEE